MAEVINTILINGVTAKCGATTLVFSLVKILNSYGYETVGIEINKNEMKVFDDPNLNIRSEDLAVELLKYVNYDFAIIDGNGAQFDEYIDFEFDLFSLSSLQIATYKKTKLISELKNKNLVLNKSILSKRDVEKFELENGFQFLTTIPYFNEYDFECTTQSLIGLLEIMGIVKKKKFNLFRKE